MVARRPASRVDAERALPPWLVRSYEVLHIFGILQAQVPVPCSVAPLLPKSAWAVVCARDLLIRLVESLADGGGSIRKRYDAENAKRAVETRASRLSHLGARHDLTVPVVRARRAEALLCAGPFLIEPPSAELVALRVAASVRKPSASAQCRLSDVCARNAGARSLAW